MVAQILGPAISTTSPSCKPIFEASNVVSKTGVSEAGTAPPEKEKSLVDQKEKSKADTKKVVEETVVQGNKE